MKSLGYYAKRLGHGTAEMFKRLPFAFYILTHPFDGFYELKRDPRNHNLPGAVFLFIVLGITSILKRQLTGYLFTEPFAQLNLNIPYELAVAVLPFILFIIANWCFTSLMDGDGKFRDIFTATAYATLPMSICNLIAIPLSNFLTLSESAMYTFIVSFGFVWCYGMVFLGMMITHQYTVKKAIATAILSIIGMAVIAFIVVLVFFLVQQVFGFVVQLYTEVSFRLNE
ncbi:MAG: YIP1 family protein [Clostridia bacterium]|nr:YIP1 family protein [Clostridia bacterium]MBO5300555.1 YIP1 family protein [Clostridia bacterium]